MQKTRVMFVVIQLEAGGSERVVLDLARGLNSNEFEIYVTAFNGGVLKTSLKEVCKNIFIINKKKGFDFSAMRKLSQIIVKNKIHVVNAHHYMPLFYSFLGTRVLNGRKLFYTEHSVPEVENIAQSKHGKIFYWMLFRLNAVVGVSKEITRKFKEHYPRHAEKFIEILNGVDIDKYTNKLKREVIRSKWGLSKTHFVVGTVANFKTVKNHVCLVRAASLLKDAYPHLRLLFVGRGFPGDSDNSEDQIRRLIEELGLQERVILTGYQENVPELLSTLDAFCLPSFSEGLPVSLLEAMASKVPVIGSRVRGIDEVVDEGRTGFFFPSNDHVKLAETLKKVIDKPDVCKQVVSNAYDFVKANHDKQIWVNHYSNMFKSSVLNSK